MARKKKQEAKKHAAAKRATTRTRSAGQKQDVGQADLLDLARCEQFLVEEAQLLDEARFDDWLDLFTADAWYWVPSQPDQPDPHETVSLIYDDRRLLETRVRRLASPRMYSQEPRSRTSRIVANVSLEATERAACTVRSKFMMVEFRRDSQRLFSGTAFHHLVLTESGIRIAWKRVDLVNCDAPLDGLTVPF
jgi:3-phenylpropionate/cinnamic acid dioxygenase small subunit